MGLESHHLLLRNRLGIREGNRAWILVHAVDQKLVVQVRGSRPAGGPDITDDLTLVYPGTSLYPATELRQVQIFGDELFAYDNADQLIYSSRGESYGTACATPSSPQETGPKNSSVS